MTTKTTKPKSFKLPQKKVAPKKRHVDPEERAMRPSSGPTVEELLAEVAVLKQALAEKVAEDTQDTQDAPAPSAAYEYEEVDKPEEVEEIVLTPPGRAMRGNLWVFNRLQEPFAVQFNNLPEEIEANEFRQFPAPIARFLAAKSVIAFLPNMKEVRAFVLEGKSDFGKPFPADISVKNRRELIDRVADPNPIGRGTDGVPTKPKLIYIG